MKNLLSFRSLIYFTGFLFLVQGCEDGCFPFTPPDNTQEAKVLNDVSQMDLDNTGDALIWTPSDSVESHFIVYEAVISNPQQQGGIATYGEKDIFITDSDTLLLSNVAGMDSTRISAYSMDQNRNASGEPAFFARSSCPIVTDDIMMLSGPACPGAVNIIERSVSATKNIAVNWNSAPDSLYHFTIIKDTFTSQFTLVLKKELGTVTYHFAKVAGCPSTNAPSKSGNDFVGSGFRISPNCSGFQVFNTNSVGNISVSVKRN